MKFKNHNPKNVQSSMKIEFEFEKSFFVLLLNGLESNLGTKLIRMLTVR